MSFKNWLKEVYPEPVYKITLDAGFSCPNRDGSISSGGCIFCDNRSFSPAHRDFAGKTIKEQIEKGKTIGRRFGYSKFIAYFQAFTNTYAPVDKLKDIYDQVVDDDDIVGLSIGTRPDCLSDEILELIAKYKAYFTQLLFVELGMQTANDKTLKLINRGHDHAQTVAAVKRCKKFGLLTVLHVIIGLPGEGEKEIIHTTNEIAKMHPHSVKIHHLYVYEGTELAKWFNEGKYKPIEYDDFIKCTAEVLCRIPEDIVIQRLVGELEGEGILAPNWGKKKAQVLDDLEKYMNEN